jgi:hypothetical protein
MTEDITEHMEAYLSETQFTDSGLHVEHHKDIIEQKYLKKRK